MLCLFYVIYQIVCFTPGSGQAACSWKVWVPSIREELKIQLGRSQIPSERWLVETWHSVQLFKSEPPSSWETLYLMNTSPHPDYDEGMWCRSVRQHPQFRLLEAMTSSSQDPAAKAGSSGAAALPGHRGPCWSTAENSPEPGVGCCLRWHHWQAWFFGTACWHHLISFLLKLAAGFCFCNYQPGPSQHLRKWGRKEVLSFRKMYKEL